MINGTAAHTVEVDDIFKDAIYHPGAPTIAAALAAAHETSASGLQFLKAVLPDPATLGPRTVGKTNIGCIFRGKKDGKEKNYYLYNICDHQECYREVGSQAVSYTTGVPAMIGAMLLMNGTWNSGYAPPATV